MIHDPLIADAILMIRPGAKFSVNGDSYDGLEWLDESQKKPTEKEVKAALADLKDSWQRDSYKRARAGAFKDAERVGKLPRNVYDQIDEIWKALEALAAGDNLPGRAVDIIRTRNEIKARFPKE